MALSVCSYVCLCSRQRTRETCRSKSVTRPSALCWASCSISVRTTSRCVMNTPRTRSTKCTRSTRCASPWVRSYSEPTADFDCSARALRKSFSRSIIHSLLFTNSSPLISPRPGIGVEAQKLASASASWQLWPRPHPAWPRGLVVFEVLFFFPGSRETFVAWCSRWSALLS